MSAAKRVFVSHASEDKERFVLRFAEALRIRGLDAWVDRWEMLPGDSLVQKIFVEGLDGADAVIVVLSENSLRKRWVQEELDVAVVQRINTGSRLIPIVLDGLTIQQLPAATRHLVHERVSDPHSIDEIADRVVRSVHGETDKPPLGVSPRFASLIARKIGRLDRIDSLVLMLLGKEAVEDWGTLFRTSDFLRTATTTLECSDEAVYDSLEVLDAERYIKISRTLGPRPGNMSRFKLTGAGLEAYARAYVPDYARLGERLVACLANWPKESGTVRELADQLDAPGLLVEHLIERLARRRLLLLSDAVGGPDRRHFTNLSVQLRRLASD
jgi:hypothetical protein